MSTAAAQNREQNREEVKGGLRQQTILVLDFGSQFSQLIARRVREASVYCELVPGTTPWSELKERHPAGLILSGGPPASTSRARRRWILKPCARASRCSASATACS